VVSAIENGVASVSLDQGQQVQALAVNCGAVGNRTVLSIRPERVQVNNVTGPNRLDAHVQELIYLGDHIRCRMQVCGRDDFIVKVPNSPEHAMLREGETCTVGWNTDDCRALDLAPDAV